MRPRLTSQAARYFATAWAVCLPVTSPAQSAEATPEPLSAIEWLERRPAQITVLRVVPLTPLEPVNEPPVAHTIFTPDVTVTPLGAAQAGSAGLLPSSVTGLPQTLWSGSHPDTLQGLMTRISVDQFPALQSLLYTLLLAEADAPPLGPSEAFLRTRVEALLTLGAVEPADALLAQSGSIGAELFDLAMDVALIKGTPDPLCATLRQRPSLSRDLAPRIYCAARGGDWDTAALSLSTADAIGALSSADVSLLEHFLDPELFAGTPLPEPTSHPTALQFRLFEAAGERLPTRALPRAFAVTDMNGDAGWKAQLDAAERLVRAGAISENRLLGVYTNHIPSASGGIWDRVEAVQRLDTALRTGDPSAALNQAEAAWESAQEAGLSAPFAALFARDLGRFPATGDTADFVTHLLLLSPEYETASQRETGRADLHIAQSIARGEAPENASGDPLSDSIRTAFSPGSQAPDHLMQMVRDAQLGEAILRAILLAASGAEGDPAALTGALAFFRSIGLEDTARRHALHILLSGESTQ